MEITKITISLRDEERLRAYVTVVFDEEFVVKGMKVIRGKKGFFVSMPSRRFKDGTFHDIAHPITRQCRERLERAILAEYERALRDRAESLSGPAEMGGDA